MVRFVRYAGAVVCVLAVVCSTTGRAATLQDLESAFQRSQWDETAQIAFELLKADPGNTTAKIRGAYALFQKGFVNSALALLKRLSTEEWKKLPQGTDRFVEVVTLFQKKVPLDVLPGRLENTSIEKVSPFLRDEVRFATGRAYLGKGNLAEARKLFSAVSRNSRYFPAARYLLGSIAVREGKTELAAQEFSHIFEPQVLDQMSEFWNDMSSNVTSHWGASVKVMLDTQGLLKSRVVAELGVLAIARLAYEKGNFKGAIAQYDRIPADSPYYSRANFEKMWALLALENHEAASAAAAMVSASDGVFVSYEARPARALILVDYGKTEESRKDLDRFDDEYARAKKALERFAEYKTPDEMPKFIAHDLSLDPRAANHRSYQASLKQEIAELRKQDMRIYPLYDALANELDPLIAQSQAEVQRISLQYAERRMKDLDRLKLQAKLIRAETYLEDRENLRKEFRAKGEPTEASAREHDEKLVALMEKAVKEVEDGLAMSKRRAFNLEFRQAELYWELATARGILSIATGKEEDRKAADAYKKKALEIAKRIGDAAAKFSKHAQAIFFAGFMQLEEGDMAGGEKTLERYVATYPRHDHTADALRILGDLHFDRNDFKGAMEYYRRVLQFPDTPIVGYALYKIGWCSYNQYEYPRALQAMEQAIVWARAKGDEKQSLNLNREARRDLIAVYAESGDHTKALSYFKRVFGEDGEQAYIDFGKELDTAGQYEKSAEVWRNIVSLNPSSPNNVQYQTYVLRGTFKLRRWPEIEKQLHELLDRYRKQLRTPTEEGTPGFEAEKMSREVILSQHYEFKGGREEADSQRILRMDGDYLAAFNDWPGAREVLYEYALDLMKAKRYADAIAPLKEHWNRFAKELKEPNKEEALRNLLVSLEKEDAKEKESEKMTPVAQDIDKYSAEYLATYPDNKNARNIAGVRAAVLFKHGAIDTGSKESEAILAKKANDTAGKVAFQNLRVAYYKKKDWKATYEWATALAAREDMKDQKKDLDRIRGEAAFLYAEGISDDEEAAKEYLKIADDPGMSFLRDKAIYNAFLRKEKSGKRVEALELANKLEKEAPKFEGLKQASGLRAGLYQEAGDYKRALPMLRRLTKDPDKDLSPEVLRQARLNAALILEALEDKENAAKEFKALIAANGTDPVAAESKRALDRMFPKVEREVASQPDGFEAVLKAARDYEKAPMPSPKKVKDLAERIKAGAVGLDNVSKGLLAVATGQGVAPKYAFEAYCALPFVYDAYATGIRGLGEKGPEELKVELEKIAAPINAKGDEVANDCLKRCEEARHEGPQFRRALARSGWRRDTVMVKRIATLSKALASGAPWIDPPQVAPNEKEILAKHLAAKADDETWYALGVARLREQERGLARLTFVDALGRKPANVGRIYNAVIVATPPATEPARIAAFEKAAMDGSVAANANLALIHLKGDRLKLAMTYVQAAADKGLFKDGPVEAALKEVMAP